MTYYGLYKITNLINGNIYIGKHRTTNLDDGYMGSGIIIRRAIDKYGIDNFAKEWLMFCEDEDELNYMERVFVDQTFVDRSDTYNLTLGGGNKQFSEQHRKKISLSLIGNKRAKGHIPSDDVRCLWSSHRKGKQLGKDNPFYGKKHDSETRKLISKHTGDAMRGRHWWNNGIVQKFSRECPIGFHAGQLINRG